jgi:cell wall assembly regulator SMI1
MVADEGALKVDADLEQAWMRIEGWLSAHAPASFTTLNAPATHEEIAETERATGFPLPGELTRLLRLHNGSNSTIPAHFMPGGTFLAGTAAIVATRAGKCSVLEYQPDAVGSWWHPQWVPFTTCCDPVKCLFINESPGPHHGKAGSFFHESGGNPGEWPSLTALLVGMADALANTSPFDRKLPVTADSALTWEDPWT